MQHTLITKDGKIMMFYILTVAVMYKDLHGGVVITDDVTKTEEILHEV
jgi:hypothetical protein